MVSISLSDIVEYALNHFQYQLYNYDEIISNDYELLKCAKLLIERTETNSRNFWKTIESMEDSKFIENELNKMAIQFNKKFKYSIYTYRYNNGFPQASILDKKSNMIYRVDVLPLDINLDTMRSINDVKECIGKNVLRDYFYL